MPNKNFSHYLNFQNDASEFNSHVSLHPKQMQICISSKKIFLSSGLIESSIIYSIFSKKKKTYVRYANINGI